MEKIIYTAIVIIIQYSIFNTQNSFAQTANDNIGSGNCLNLDGVNDYISVPDDNALEPANITLEAWVYSTNSSTHDEGIVCKDDGSKERSYGLRIDHGLSDDVRFHILVGGAGHQTNTPMLFDQWVHVAGSYDGSQIKLYVNGELKDSKNVSGNIDYGADDLWIGRYFDNSRYLEGRIDEVRIWSVARTQTEIKDNMCNQLQGNESNLVGYWNMNEGTGNTVGDLTANGNDGTRQ